MSSSETGWEVRVAASAAKEFQRLPEKAATAIVEFILGPLTHNPYRLGKALRSELAERHSARRGPYRVIYELETKGRIIRVLQIQHRSGVYRSR